MLFYKQYAICVNSNINKRGLTKNSKNKFKFLKLETQN